MNSAISGTSYAGDVAELRRSDRQLLDFAGRYALPMSSSSWEYKYTSPT